MPRQLLRCIAIAAIFGVLSNGATAKEADVSLVVEGHTSVDTFGSHPSPAFFENLAVLPSGTVLYTSYLSKSEIASSPDGSLVVAHIFAFNERPQTTSTKRFVVEAGESTNKVLLAPSARSLNSSPILFATHSDNVPPCLNERLAAFAGGATETRAFWEAMPGGETHCMAAFFNSMCTLTTIGVCCDHTRVWSCAR